jgi:hypothetical protein
VLKRHFPYVMTIRNPMTPQEAHEVEGWLNEISPQGWQMMHLAADTPPVVAIKDPDIAVAFRLRWC